jgi:hypothetical protein
MRSVLPADTAIAEAALARATGLGVLGVVIALSGGAFVNVIAYQADYVSAKEQLQVLAATARAKNCATAENWGSNSSIR